MKEEKIAELLIIEKDGHKYPAAKLALSSDFYFDPLIVGGQCMSYINAIKNCLDDEDKQKQFTIAVIRFLIDMMDEKYMFYETSPTKDE